LRRALLRRDRGARPVLRHRRRSAHRARRDAVLLRILTQAPPCVARHGFYDPRIKDGRYSAGRSIPSSVSTVAATFARPGPSTFANASDGADGAHTWNGTGFSVWL